MWERLAPIRCWFFARQRGCLHAGHMTLPARAKSTTSGSGPCGLSGRLDQVGVATLLTLIDLEHRSGILFLRRPRETAALWLRRGRVIRARTEGAGARSGEPALFHLLSWSAGRFELTFDESVEGLDEIGRSTAHLLMEAARRTDEASARTRA